jgi:hypothetical protein
MTAAARSFDRIPPDWGGPLTEADYKVLEASWITPEIADAAILCRVDDHEAAEIVGQKRRPGCAGTLYPYYWPDGPRPVNYRIRRDNPDVVQGIDGSIKLEHKYLSAPGSGNRLFIPPGITLEQLADPAMPLIIVEGEKKSLALRRLASHACDHLRFVPIAISGVWNWMGTAEKRAAQTGND